MILSPELRRKGISILQDNLDPRQVMWELTNHSLEIIFVDHFGMFEWLIFPRGASKHDYGFAIRIETNGWGKLFTVTARRSYLGDAEDLERYGLRREGSDYVYDTDSPNMVLSMLDRLIDYIEV